MFIGFRMEIDKSTHLVNPHFEDEEIDWWLNQAVEKFVKTRYSGLNSKGESFEQTQKRIDDLRTLIVEESIVPIAGTADVHKTNSYVATLPTPATIYMFALGEEVTVTNLLDVLIGKFGITQCTVDTYRDMIDNPFSEHILHYNECKPLRLFYGNVVELVTDGNYKVTKYHIRYLKQPAVIDGTGPVNCDLPVHTHSEIVKLAANMVLENIEQPRYQTHTAEVATME